MDAFFGDFSANFEFELEMALEQGFTHCEKNEG